ncbi:sodium:calcium antiporter [Jeotgalibacillus soli]|uniref:Cation transporter n=1 Tax=Jeotgalibacillus soli TaxID=889306 RepID=A0A0C2W638_9BACL|nr:sodium:calcium antiporter [Jeotgalibacillus soli]KIL52021.1 cation transporter [Jeotgalibacillus soli]
MVFVYFILAAAVTVFAAMKLSKYADVMSEKTAMGGLMVGTLLLAGATSLPEVTTSISAVLIGNPDIAIGNVLGSNLFNLFILACFDLYYRKKQLYQWGSKDHVYTAGLGLVLTVMVMLALIVRIDFTILGIGIDSLLIALVYGVGLFIMNKLPKPAAVEPVVDQQAANETAATAVSSISVKHAVIGFIVAALVIMGAGTVLSIMGDQIAVITGLGSSFVGSFLVAATTSLPEAVSVLVALRLRNVNLALGSILGSNIFNMLILAMSDVAYRDGSILADVSDSHLVTAIGVLILSVVIIGALFRKPTKSIMSYAVPSLLIVLGYFITSYLIFIG